MIKPLSARVVVKRDKPEEKTINNIVIPNKEKQNTGEVMAVGIDCKELKIGDRVLFAKYVVGEYQDGDDELILIKEEEIWGIL